MYNYGASLINNTTPLELDYRFAHNCFGLRMHKLRVLPTFIDPTVKECLTTQKYNVQRLKKGKLSNFILK